jgi:hypothetical protein
LKLVVIDFDFSRKNIQEPWLYIWIFGKIFEEPRLE